MTPRGTSTDCAHLTRLSYECRAEPQSAHTGYAGPAEACPGPVRPAALRGGCPVLAAPPARWSSNRRTKRHGERRAVYRRTRS